MPQIRFHNLIFKEYGDCSIRVLMTNLATLCHVIVIVLLGYLSTNQAKYYHEPCSQYQYYSHFILAVQLSWLVKILTMSGKICDACIYDNW